MPKNTVTHFGEFSQGFSYPFPVLKEREAWKSAPYRRTRPAFRVAVATEEERGKRESSFMIERKGLSPTRPNPFQILS